MTDDPNLPLVKRAQRGDERARSDLVRVNRGIIAIYARAMVGRCTTLDVDDLINEGSMGLLRALDKFEPSRGVKFLTYANHWIFQYIQRAANDDHSSFGGAGGHRDLVASGRLKRQRTEFLAAGFTEQEANLKLAAMNRSTPETMAAMRALEKRFVVSLDRASAGHERNSDGEESRALYAVLSDGSVMPDDLTHQLRVDSRVREAVEAVRATLLPREQEILDRRLYPGCESLGAIGDSLGLCRERVRQLELRIVHKLRGLLYDIRPCDGRQSVRSETRRPSMALALRTIFDPKVESSCVAPAPRSGVLCGRIATSAGPRGEPLCTRHLAKARSALKADRPSRTRASATDRRAVAV